MKEFVKAFDKIISDRREEIVPLERIKHAIDFYARHEHWMGQTEDDDLHRVLTAMQGEGKQDGWRVAEDVQDDLWAIEQLIEMISQTEKEALLTIDRMNAEKASSARISVETLMWWRQLLDLNPSDLAPRIDALIADIRTGTRVVSP